MRAYSSDLRERIVRAVDQGRSQREAARLFGVGVSSVNRYLQQRARTGSLARCPPCVAYFEQMVLTVRAAGGLSEEIATADSTHHLLHVFRSWKPEQQDQP